MLYSNQSSLLALASSDEINLCLVSSSQGFFESSLTIRANKMSSTGSNIDQSTLLKHSAELTLSGLRFDLAFQCSNLVHCSQPHRSQNNACCPHSCRSDGLRLHQAAPVLYDFSRNQLLNRRNFGMIHACKVCINQAFFLREYADRRSTEKTGNLPPNSNVALDRRNAHYCFRPLIIPRNNCRLREPSSGRYPDLFFNI